MENQDTFWVVWREGDRAPVVKHETRDEARIESWRLANKDQGNDFHVLQCIGTAHVDPDPIKRVWEQYKHLDILLSDPDWMLEAGHPMEPQRKCLLDCWAAIKESQEEKGCHDLMMGGRE